MTPTSAKIVLFIVLSLSPAFALAQEFNGPFVGFEAGRQHVIGGALVDGVDTLQDDSRMVFSGFGGLRIQRQGFVIGAELGLGRTDGDLSLAESGLDVDYRNDSQWHWGLHAGRMVGGRTLVFGYLSEVARKFDVTITQAAGMTSQQDEQGLLRFGGGVEFALRGPLHARVTAGTSRADFGARALNKNIGRRLDAAAAVVLQF